MPHHAPPDRGATAGRRGVGGAAVWRWMTRPRTIRVSPLAGLADWEVTVRLANALGYPMRYQHPSEIMAEIAALTPTFHGVSYEKLDRLGSIQWPCNEAAPNGTLTMHIDHFVRGKGKFFVTEYVPTSERSTSRYPLLLTTGRILSQYNVGAQTRRTHNVMWHNEDRLEIHPHDAETRGIEHDDWVGIASRAGDEHDLEPANIDRQAIDQIDLRIQPIVVAADQLTLLPEEVYRGRELRLVERVRVLDAQLGLRGHALHARHQVRPHLPQQRPDGVDHAGVLVAGNFLHSLR